MLTDTAAIAAAVMFITGLARRIIDGFGYTVTGSAVLLFLVLCAPAVALAGYSLGVVDVAGWRAAAVLGLTAIPVAMGLYESTRRQTPADRDEPLPELPRARDGGGA